jgi:putative tricarboxylic transport membrane protein
LRPIILMAPANPGGGWDQLARLIQLVLTEERIVPVPLQVVNRGGAGGTIGLAELAVRNRNDEHTIMIAGSVMVGAVVAHRSPFGLDDTEPVARLTSEYLVIAVPPDSPYGTIGDLMRAFREKPASIVWGGGSAGGTDHQVVALLGREAGVPLKSIRYVAFAGGGEAATAVMGSQLTAMVTGYGEIQHLAKAGRVRLLATTAAEPFSSDAPPTLLSAGVPIVVSNWRGVLAPPGASPEGTAWLVEAFRRMRETDAWRSILERNEWEDSFLVGDEFKTFLDEERVRAEAILGELEFGSGGAGYAAIGAWTFPTIILGMLALSTIWVVRRRAGGITEQEHLVDPGHVDAVSWSRLAATGALLMLFVWSMDLLGYHLATVVLLVGLARVFGSQSLTKELVFAGALAVASFALFDGLLGVSLPTGPFAGVSR